MSALGTVVVLDAAPPPPAKMFRGSASTLAFELSDGAQRLVVNCGGPGLLPTALSDELVQGLFDAFHQDSQAVLVGGGMRSPAAFVGDACDGEPSPGDDFTHCRVMGGAAEGAACLEDSDCTAGSLCADGACRKYCNVATGSTCALPDPQFCSPLTPALTINGTTYGSCLL